RMRCSDQISQPAHLTIAWFYGQARCLSTQRQSAFCLLGPEAAMATRAYRELNRNAHTWQRDDHAIRDRKLEGERWSIVAPDKRALGARSGVFGHVGDRAGLGIDRDGGPDRPARQTLTDASV